MYPGGSNVITNVLLISERGQQETQRFEDAMLPALKTEKRTTSQGMPVASGSWKKETDFLLVSRRNAALPTP